MDGLDYREIIDSWYAVARGRIDGLPECISPFPHESIFRRELVKQAAKFAADRPKENPRVGEGLNLRKRRKVQPKHNNPQFKEAIEDFELKMASSLANPASQDSHYHALAALRKVASFAGVQASHTLVERPHDEIDLSQMLADIMDGESQPHTPSQVGYQGEPEMEPPTSVISSAIH